jgi:serralysin
MVSNPERDTQYELLVRGAANAYFAPELRSQVEAGLKNQGYVVDQVFNSDPENTTSTTFRGLGLRSIDGSKPPVLIMPGGFGSDNPKGEGFDEFQANQQAIYDWLTSIARNPEFNPQGLKPDITGGSLGGAFTQWIASEFPTAIGSAISFAASGISRDASKSFIANGGNPNQVVHYIADGDYRSLEGEAFLPGEAIVSNFSTPLDENFTEVKHQSLFFNEVDTIRKFLSLPDDSPRGIATLPPDRVLTKVPVEDLNRPDFTFSGQDWQTALAAIRAYNPNLATLVSDRQNIEELRINANTDLPALIADIINGSNPIPPEQINQPTAGNDILFGSDRHDKISGNAGDDYIRGLNGNDILYGNEGNDSLIGGKGRDTLAGGAGDDILTGGVGKDRFLFGSDTPFNPVNMGIDRITDFNSKEDLISLSASTFNALGKQPRDFFATVTNDAAAATSLGSIVYNSSNGNLFYNPDGAVDGFANGGQFANLFNSPNLSPDNFCLT